MNKSKKRSDLLVFVILIVIVALIFGIILFVGQKRDDKKLKVGMIVNGSVSEFGWNYMNYEGMKDACDAFSAKLLIKENILDNTGTCSGAIRELADQGAQLIILTSFNYTLEEDVQEMVRSLPDITFCVSSFEYTESNVMSYFSRLYQARYLAGILAGSMTKSNEIGYVAAFPTSEVNRGINAFTLGVRRVNPDAIVKVKWTNSWDDEKMEKHYAKELITEGADVLTCHQNQPYVAQAAEESGVYSIGYHEALENASENFLGAVVCNWSTTYSELIKSYLQGDKNKQEYFWYGMESDAVALSQLSGAVPQSVKDEIEAAKSEILSGKDVFSRTITDIQGNIRCQEGESISDDSLLKNFDWYVEGVVFDEE